MMSCPTVAITPWHWCSAWVVRGTRPCFGPSHAAPFNTHTLPQLLSPYLPAHPPHCSNSGGGGKCTFIQTIRSHATHRRATTTPTYMLTILIPYMAVQVWNFGPESQQAIAAVMQVQDLSFFSFPHPPPATATITD